MQNGWLLIQNYAHGVIKRFKGQLDVIICLVFVEKVFAICVQNHGNLIIKITLSVIFIKKVVMKIFRNKKLY